MKKLIGLLVLVAAALSMSTGLHAAAAGVGQGGASNEKPRLRKKALKQGGWQVPGAGEYRTVETVLKKRIDDVEVTQKVFKAEARPVVDLDGNTLGNIDQRGINITPQVAKKKQQLFDVRGFSAYEAGGRIFAYGVTLVPLVVEKNLRTYAGAMYSVFYYDEDGDGRFEARYGGLPPPKVPDWAAAQNQPGHDR